MENRRYRAMLLLGPTGAGKTPFGEQLEAEKLWNKKYHHFDFGENLRKAARSASEAGTETAEGLTHTELETIRSVLESNALLQDRDFPIAEKILSAFIREKNINPSSDIIILNGLPRHTAQAEKLAKTVNVMLVMVFTAPADVIFERIKNNSGGDRTGRKDDSTEEIKRKLDIFRKETLPLVEFYKNLDRTILEIAVETDTLPVNIIQGLETMPAIL